MKIENKIHNYFDIQVVDAETNEVKQDTRSYNVVCNAFAPELYKKQMMYTNAICYGEGTGTPAATDTALFGYLDKKECVVSSSIDENTRTYTRTLTYVMPPSDHNGKTITEIGLLRHVNYSNPLLTHAMIVDENGNTKGILKTDKDKLIITAKLFVVLGELPAGTVVDWGQYKAYLDGRFGTFGNENDMRIDGYYSKTTNPLITGGICEQLPGIMPPTASPFKYISGVDKSGSWYQGFSLVRQWYVSAGSNGAVPMFRFPFTAMTGTKNWELKDVFVENGTGAIDKFNIPDHITDVKDKIKVKVNNVEVSNYSLVKYKIPFISEFNHNGVSVNINRFNMPDGSIISGGGYDSYGTIEWRGGRRFSITDGVMQFLPLPAIYSKLNTLPNVINGNTKKNFFRFLDDSHMMLGTYTTSYNPQATVAKLEENNIWKFGNSISGMGMWSTFNNDKTKIFFGDSLTLYDFNKDTLELTNRVVLSSVAGRIVAIINNNPLLQDTNGEVVNFNTETNKLNVVNVTKGANRLWIAHNTFARFDTNNIIIEKYNEETNSITNTYTYNFGKNISSMTAFGIDMNNCIIVINNESYTLQYGLDGNDVHLIHYIKETNWSILWNENFPTFTLGNATNESTDINAGFWRIEFNEAPALGDVISVDIKPTALYKTTDFVCETTFSMAFSN